MIHVIDKAIPEKRSNVPGTFFSHADFTSALSAKITSPIIIKIIEMVVNEIKTVVDNILKRFMVMLKLIHVILKW
jgi:hypothetical protein